MGNKFQVVNLSAVIQNELMRSLNCDLGGLKLNCNDSLRSCASILPSSFPHACLDVSQSHKTASDNEIRREEWASGRVRVDITSTLLMFEKGQTAGHK